MTIDWIDGLTIIWGLGLIFFTGFFIRRSPPLWKSITFWIIVVGTALIIIYVLFQEMILGDIEKLSLTVILFYYSQIILVLSAFFSGLVIGLSILWYSYKDVQNKWYLKIQSGIILSFFVYVLSIIFLSTILPLKDQIIILGSIL